MYETSTIGYSAEKGFYKTTELNVGTYCPLCGKVGAVEDIEFKVNTSPLNKFYCYEWSEKAKREFDPATRTLPFFKLDQFKDKFVMTTVSSNGSHI